MKVTITVDEFAALERVTTAALEASFDERLADDQRQSDRTVERAFRRADVRAVDNVLDRVRAHTLRGVG